MGNLTFGSTKSSSNTRWQVAAPAVQGPFLSVAASSLRLEINLLKPNDIYIYICRTAALTSRRYILNIYSTNIHTEYFKHAA